MHVFYLPDASAGLIQLSEDESKHCIRVLRMKSGQQLLITNGKGLIFTGEIVESHPKKAIVRLFEPHEGYDHTGYHLHIAIAPTKNIERLEWFLEKATEIGVNEISLFHSFQSERRHANTERLEKIVIAAMKQSIRACLPTLNGIVSFEQLITQPFDGQKFIAWIDENVTTQLRHLYKPNHNCLILIGPEGDFSSDEVQRAITLGFVPVSLGNARLRTETAGIVACHTIQFINQLNQ